MYLDKGFVKIEGVTDLEDASVAAGMCAVFEYPIQFDITKHIRPDGKYQRCDNSKYLFSRDQTICLVAGLLAKGYSSLVGLDKVDGHDFFSPSARGHVRICKGLKPYWYQTLWFKMDLWFSATFKPDAELNQILTMIYVHPDRSLLAWYCEMNPLWNMAILNYWCQGEGKWRDEKQFAYHVEKKIFDRIK